MDEHSSPTDSISPLPPCSSLSLAGMDSCSTNDNSNSHSDCRQLAPLSVPPGLHWRTTTASHISSPGWSSSPDSYECWSGDTDPSLGSPSEIATSPVTPNKSPALRISGRFMWERRTSLPVLSGNDLPSYKVLPSEQAQTELIRRGPKHHWFRLRSHLKQDNILEWLEGAECQPRFTPIFCRYSPS